MNAVFDWCVRFLEWLGPLVGMTYKEINVWLFVILEPLVFVGMFILLLVQRKKIRLLQRKIKDHGIRN